MKEAAYQTDFLDTEEEEDDLFFTSPIRKKGRIGEELCALNQITSDQLRIALVEQKTSPKEMLGTILVRLGFIREQALAEALAAQAGLKTADLESLDLKTNIFHLLPVSVATRYLVLPLKITDQQVSIALADPFDVLAMDEVRRYLPRNLKIVPFVAARQSLANIIEKMKDSFESVDRILQEMEREPSAHKDTVNYEPPTIRLVNFILTDAARRGASDIHFEPEDTFLRVRFRLDGALKQVHVFHLNHWPALSHRLKIMAGMNIADTRSIQDGRFQMQIGAGQVDFRVAIMPTVWGETIVVRLLDHRRSLLPLDILGYSKIALANLKTILRKPQGITLVTGPTGSGKTTTLYSLLQELNKPDVHIATLEEPVEFQLNQIRQTSIQDAIGLDFAAGVRGLLRMDPDIILIGEVRDSETAQMALRAAMTGHQVYTTLHCNDALGALPRLIDLGLSHQVLPGNLSGIIAQRLVRTLCPACKEKRQATAEEKELLGLPVDSLCEIAVPCGCDLCEGTGRKGRTVVAEVLPLSPALDDLVSKKAERAELLHGARDEGFQTLQEDGVHKVLDHEIALEDLSRSVDMTRCINTKKRGNP